MTARLILMASLSFAWSVDCASIVWSSGTITLPSGMKASVLDVYGVAWITSSMNCASYLHAVSDISYYNAVQSGNLIDDLPVNSHVKGGTWAKTGVSDASGKVAITDGVNGPDLFNEWAVVLYTCVEDGYEWYMKVNAGHYATGYNNETDNRSTNLASYGTWIRGDAVPEPTSAAFLSCGFMFLMLKRRQISPAAHRFIQPSLAVSVPGDSSTANEQACA